MEYFAIRYDNDGIGISIQLIFLLAY